MLNNFIYAQTKELFLEALGAGNILDEAIVFIEDTKEIWNHGHYFAGDCGFDSNAFSALQTAVAQMQASKLDSSTAESTYAKKTELPSLDGYLTKSAAESLYTTISQYNTLNNTVNQLTTTVNNKAEQDGTYPDMTVGTAEMAETLGGRPFINNAEFTFRATADKNNSVTDGMATITKLMGNSVVWNNPWQVNNYNNQATGVTAEWDDAHSVIAVYGTLNADSSSDQNIYGAFRELSTNKNDKWAIISNGSKHYMLYTYGAVSMGTDKSSVIAVANSTGTFNISLRPIDGVAVGTQIQENITPEIVNLTKMFGEGNEPTTIEEYYLRKPIGVEGIKVEGEVFNMNAKCIKSVGDNAWDEQWEVGNINLFTGENEESIYKIRSKNYIKILPNTRYFFRKPSGAYVLPYYYDEDKQFIASDDVLYTSEEGNEFTTMNAAYMRFSCTYVNYEIQYNNDLMLTLVHSGWKQDTDAGYQPYWEDILTFDPRIKEAFPNGMQKWDSVYNKNGKGYIVKGTGVLNNLGSQINNYYGTVSFSTTGYIMCSTDAIQNLVYKSPANNLSGEVICAAYPTRSADSIYLENEGIDIDIDGRLHLFDNTHRLASDYNTIKNKLANTTVYYRLANPEIIEYDTPFNLSYRVADFGTEEVIESQVSAALRAQIEYGFNAYDTIVTNKLAIQDLSEQIDSLSVDWELIENKPFYETVTTITDFSPYDTGSSFEIPVAEDEHTTIVVSGWDYETVNFDFVLNLNNPYDSYTDSDDHTYSASWDDDLLTLSSTHEYLSDFHNVQITVVKPLSKEYVSNVSKLIVENDNGEKVYIYESNALNQLVIGADDGISVHTRGAETIISDIGIDTNGSVSATNGFFQTSDANLKNFSDPIPVDLEKLSTLKKHYFTWKTGGERQIGVCAQEIQELYPEIVNQSNDGTLSVDYTKLSVVALAAIDDLYKKNQELEERLAKLESILLNKN